MLFKQGVSPIGLSRPMRKFLGALERVAPDFVVTSTAADAHQADSCHYTGDAADIRRVTYRGKKIDIELLRGVGRMIEGELAAKPCSFDFAEYEWGFHVEWDPK